MPIKMDGYKVAYGKHVYSCLQVELIFGPGSLNNEGHIEYPEILRVFILDHDIHIAVIEDCANKFRFFKEE